jgi:hypothetical protein
MQGNRLFVAGRPRPVSLSGRPGWLQLAIMTIMSCALYPSIGKTQTLQDVIEEACALSDYPFLPPCGSQITLKELNSRLNYKLHMMEAENKELKITMSAWNNLLGLLYMNPTQTVWDSLMQAAKALSTDLVWPQASRAIEEQGVVFLADTNGDADLVRNNILRYIVTNNGMDKSRVKELENISKEKIDPTLLFHVDAPE